jgi:hypothetical protein
MLGDVDWTAVVGYAPLIAGFIAAGVAAYSARISYRSSRNLLARDLVQAKIAALTSCLRALHSIDFRTPINIYSYDVSRQPENAGDLGMVMLYALIARFVEARTEVITVSHYLTEAVHRKGESLQDAGNEATNEISRRLKQGPVLPDDALAKLIAPLESFVVEMSVAIQEEREACVRVWERTAKVEWPRTKPTPRAAMQPQRAPSTRP